MSDVLTEDQMTRIVCKALAGIRASSEVWRDFTYDVGPYEISRLRHATLTVCRAIEAAVREQLKPQPLLPTPLSDAEVRHIIRTTPGPEGYCAALVRAGFDAALAADAIVKHQEDAG